jgi:hypothetical protein
LRDCAALKIAKPVSATSINSEQQSLVPGSPQYEVNWKNEIPLLRNQDITTISQELHSTEYETSIKTSNFAILVINILTLWLWNDNFVVIISIVSL